MFSVAAHLVGAALGLEPSCRILMSREAAVTGSSTVTFLLFNRLKWTPANDDLFEQAI
jgi:hypothetical protein